MHATCMSHPMAHNIKHTAQSNSPSLELTKTKSSRLVERQNTETSQSASGVITLATILLIPVMEPRAPTSTTNGRHLHSANVTLELPQTGSKTAKERPHCHGWNFPIIPSLTSTEDLSPLGLQPASYFSCIKDRNVAPHKVVIDAMSHVKAPHGKKTLDECSCTTHFAEVLYPISQNTL